MSIPFRELISLPLFESIQLLTGASGLSAPAFGIGISDYEYAENMKNHCRVRQSALALFQYENTIRYRLAKIRQVLGMEKDPGRLDLELTLAFLLKGLLPL